MPKKILYALYQPYKWLVYIPLFVLSTLLTGAVAVTLATLINPRIGSILAGTAWARLNAFMTPMWVTVTGREHLDPEQSYVIVANHQSHFDIFVLYGWLGLDFKWVLKQELRRIPGLGIGCEKVGHIFIDRSDTAAAIRSLKAARAVIRNGTSVIFFAEGTQSPDGKLLPFKKGAFKMALDLDLPILPITLLGTREIQPPQTFSLFPGGAELRFHPPVSLDAYRGGNLRPLIDEVRRRIDSGLPPDCRSY